MKYKVVFDTNSIRNSDSIENFLGNRDELERFLKVSEIIIPEIVVDEIKAQKRRGLISKRDAFLANPFHILRKIDRNKTSNFDIEKYIQDLQTNEIIPFTIIHLTKPTALEEIKKLCIKNEPPFEDGSDKGFKDSIIFFSILEYIESCNEDRIFVVTQDERLTKAFVGLSRIKVVKDFEEFEKYTDNYFREEYFISRLREEFADRFSKGTISTINVNGIKSDRIVDTWLNVESNWIIKISLDNKVFFIEVDFSSREIIDITDSNFADNIVGLVSSGDFRTTHDQIELIKDYTNYFSNEQIQNIIEAATTNDQIYSISTDEDVKEFLLPLFKSKSQIFDEEVKKEFSRLYVTN